VQGGQLQIVVGDAEKTVRLTRAHLEEDAGKSLHETFRDSTGIDLNRAGTPLLEIVSEPDMRSAEEAVAYAKALHSLVRWIDICNGNMQEGSFRFDANISVRRKGSDKLGTRCEIKNLNSFRFLERAIEFEATRQIEILQDGGVIEQETRLYDPDKDETRSMRTKEEAHDYRYFPDPDLLPLEISERWIGDIKRSIPPLPRQIMARFLARSYEEYEAWETKIEIWVDEAAGQVVYGLPEQQARELASDLDRAHYFMETAKIAGVENAKLCANWILGDLASYLNRDDLEIRKSRVSSSQLAALVRRVADGSISGKIAKEVFDAMWAAEGDPDAIIEKRGLRQISDSGDLERICDAVIAANPAQVADYRAGKAKAFNFLVGQAMKASGGKANPAQLNEILKRKLAG